MAVTMLAMFAGCNGVGMPTRPEVSTPDRTQACYSKGGTDEEIRACLKANPVSNSRNRTLSTRSMRHSLRMMSNTDFDAVMALLSQTDAQVAASLTITGFTATDAETFLSTMDAGQSALFNATMPVARFDHIISLMPAGTQRYYFEVYRVVHDDGYLPAGW